MDRKVEFGLPDLEVGGVWGRLPDLEVVVVWTPDLEVGGVWGYLI